MLYTVGDFDRSNYKISFAYSDVMIPTVGKQYIKPKIRDTKNIWENPAATDEVYYLLQTQTDKWFNYYGKVIDGPGVCNLVQYDGDYYILFHARNPDLTNTPASGKNWGGHGRWMWTCPIEIDFSKTITEWIKPLLSDSQ